MKTRIETVDLILQGVGLRFAGSRGSVKLSFIV